MSTSNEEVLPARRLDLMTLNNSAVQHILCSGGTAEDCVIELVAQIDLLHKQLVDLIAIAPFKVRLADGTVVIWRCPDEYVPFRAGFEENNDE